MVPADLESVAKENSHNICMVQAWCTYVALNDSCQAVKIALQWYEELWNSNRSELRVVTGFRET